MSLKQERCSAAPLHWCCIELVSGGAHVLPFGSSKKGLEKWSFAPEVGEMWIKAEGL